MTKFRPSHYKFLAMLLCISTAGISPTMAAPAPGAARATIKKRAISRNYGVPTFTTGLRNLTGKVNNDGTVTIYATTAQTSTVSGGEPDPTKLVAVTDEIAATQLPADDGKGWGGNNWGSWGGGQPALDQFVTLQQSRSGEVFRGVAFAPGR